MTDYILLAIVIIFVLWYYMFIYRKGKTLSSMFAPAPPTVNITVPVKEEEITDDITEHMNKFDEKSLAENL